MERWSWESVDVGNKKVKICQETKIPLKSLHEKGMGEGFSSFAKERIQFVENFLTSEVGLDEIFVDHALNLAGVERETFFTSDLTDIKSVKLCCAAVYVVLKSINFKIDEAFEKKNVLKLVGVEESKEDVENLLKATKNALCKLSANNYFI